MQNTAVQFSFYDDYIYQVDYTGTSTVKYADFYRILESKNGIFLMIAKNQGFSINKADCSEELLEFLRNIKTK